MMQVDRQANGLTVLAAARGDLKVESGRCGEAFHKEVSRVILRMLEGGSFRGNLAVSCLPSLVMHYKNLRLPKMPADELAAAVQWEASDRLHLGEATTIQFFDAGHVQQGTDQRQEIILLAATNKLIDQHTTALVDSGLQPIAIDAIPAALARCLGKDDTEGKVRVVIDVGYSSSKVQICHGERVMFYKQIDIGGRAFDQAIIDHLNVTHQEASNVRHNLGQCDEQVRHSVHEAVGPMLVELSREIGLCLRYYSVTFRGQRPDRAILVGGEAHQHDLAAVIGEGAALDVNEDDLLAGFDLSAVSDVVGEASEHNQWVVAAGLALRPMGHSGGSSGGLSSGLRGAA